MRQIERARYVAGLVFIGAAHIQQHEVLLAAFLAVIVLFLFIGSFKNVITAAIETVFDLRPAAIIRDLDLLRPIYSATSTYGHFGRDLPDFTWEALDRVDALRAAAGL